MTLDDAHRTNARTPYQRASFLVVTAGRSILSAGKAATEPLAISFTGITSRRCGPRRRKRSQLEFWQCHEIMDLFEKLDGWLMRETHGKSTHAPCYGRGVVRV